MIALDLEQPTWLKATTMVSTVDLEQAYCIPHCWLQKLANRYTIEFNKASNVSW